MTTLELKMKFIAKLPMVPSFLMAADGSDKKVAIEELDEATLREIGERWTAALISAARNRRYNKIGGEK